MCQSLAPIKHAQRAGAGSLFYLRDKTGLHLDEITVPELLKQDDYATGIVDTWRLFAWEQLNPVNHGFDSFDGFTAFDEDRSQ